MSVPQVRNNNKCFIIAISTTHKQCWGTGIIIKLTLEFVLPFSVTTLMLKILMSFVEF